MLENMPWTSPTCSRFWPDWPTSRGRFHSLSLDMPTLISYQPTVEFWGHSDHFHISNLLKFLSDPPTSGEFLQAKSGSNLFHLLPTYGTFFWSFLFTCLNHPFYFLIHSLVLHHKLSYAHF